MAKSNAPYNGPSKTGNPSGMGRGNNPPGGAGCNDATDDQVWSGGDPFEGYAERAAASMDRVIHQQVRRDEQRRLAWQAWGDRDWVATTLRDVEAAAEERFAPYELDNRSKRLALFVRACQAEYGDAVAGQVVDVVCALLRENGVLVGNLARKDSALMDEVQRQLTLADWVHYYDAQFVRFDDYALAPWEQCKALLGSLEQHAYVE